MLALENLRGIMLMVISMAAFAVEDMLIKLASESMSVGQILAILGAVDGAIFYLLLRANGERLLGRDLLQAPVILRNMGEVFGSLAFVTAIVLIPISTASSILQASPLVVTMGAALFLGEAVGWRRWTATFIGFLGVLMVVRPGLEGFDANALFAVAGVIGLAIRDVATRAIPRSLTSLRLGALAMLLLVPTGLIMASFSGGFQTPSPMSLVYISIAAIIGVGGYYAVTSATRLGEISVIAPFRYSRLVFAMLVGIFVFSERPDLWTMLGAAIIILSGIYTFVRERRIRQKLAAAAALQF
jgi:drug/metabolite transporter (DMT)-like permease